MRDPPTYLSKFLARPFLGVKIGGKFASVIFGDGNVKTGNTHKINDIAFVAAKEGRKIVRAGFEWGFWGAPRARCGVCDACAERARCVRVGVVGAIGAIGMIGGIG